MSENIEKAHIASGRHFIPYRQSDIVEMCLQGSSLTGQEENFKHFHHLLDNIFHLDFHRSIEQLKAAYTPIDPDSDTRDIRPIEADTGGEFVQLLERLLERANYKAVTKQDLELAISDSSLFKIRLKVDFEDFSQVLLFCRGVSTRRETVFRFAGRFPKTIEFINYDRVMIFIRFRDDYEQDDTPLPYCKPGSTMLKLFRNVPRADMEMLFPNTRIGMRLLDKLMIGVPAVVSGGVIITTKLASSLILLGSLIGFWLGLDSQPVELNKTTLMILLAGVATLGGYIWKQFSAFKNRKMSFMQSLTQNLYFKNLDNNAGVFHRLADDAEEEECKEAILAYYFLLMSTHALKRDDLDREIENWFKTQWNCILNFDIEDALQKLRALKLVEESEGLYSAIPLNDGIEKLNRYWRDYFDTPATGLAETT